MRFSIIIPVYNKSRYIAKTIESVLAQSVDDFELILVNDGSTDTSLEIMRSIHDCRIRIMDKANGGVSSARNAGISTAQGEWITFFDADDIMYPDALETYLKVIKSMPAYKVIAAATDQSCKRYNSNGSVRIVTDYDMQNAISYAQSGFSLINTDCICIHKSVFRKVSMFNETYTHGEDMDLWKRISEVYHIVKIEKAVGLYVQDTSNNSSCVASSNRKYAPIALIEHPRKEFTNYSSKLLQGGRVFFEVFPSIFPAPSRRKLYLLFYYLDWTVLFACYLVYYRIIKR